MLDTDGKVLRPESGTPQGGIISPVLANVYLHYALDLWFERVVQRSCKGGAFLHRYADDFVCGFGRAEEAQRFYNELEERLRKFGLELAQDKTRVMPFSRYRQGETSFEFLGFEFRWGVNRKGQAWLKRRTARKRLRNSLKRVTEWCRQNRHRRLREQVQLLDAKLCGYYNYYGVNGNRASLDEFFYHLRRIHQRWLNQRSQRHSYTWAAYTELKWRFPSRTLETFEGQARLALDGLMGAGYTKLSDVDKIVKQTDRGRAALMSKIKDHVRTADDGTIPSSIEPALALTLAVPDWKALTPWGPTLEEVIENHLKGSKTD